VVKSALVKKLVYGVLGLVANAKNRAEGGRSGAKVGDFAQELQAVALGLQGVFFGRTVAVYHDFLYLNLHRLAASLRRNQYPAHLNRSTGRNAFERGFRRLLKIDDALQIGTR
jgi:hypothetical protein